MLLPLALLSCCALASGAIAKPPRERALELAAQASGVRYTARVVPPALDLTGELICEERLELEPGIEATLPTDADRLLDGLQVITRTATIRKPQPGGSTLLIRTTRFEPLQLGVVGWHAASLWYRPHGAAPERELALPSLSVPVRPPAALPSHDPQPRTETSASRTEPRAAPDPALYAALAAVLLAALTLAARALRKRRRARNRSARPQPDSERQEVASSSDTAALLKRALAAASSSRSSHDLRPLLDDVAAALRTELALCGVAFAHSQSARELRRRLAATPDTRPLEPLARALERLDLLRFAPGPATLGPQIRDVLEAALRVIEQRAPQTSPREAASNAGMRSAQSETTP